jgi:putative endonuclease
MFYVYILRCKDKSYYTGHTDNLENRLNQHYSAVFPTCYTASRLPVELMYSTTFATRIEAITAEKQIQGWTRKKKEALINEDWDKLSSLAKRQNKKFR